MADSMLTIAIPTYKRPDFLTQAIDSAINQNNVRLKYEVLVVNNDPESDLQELQKRYTNTPVTVRIVKNETNLGMLGNVNRCVALVQSPYVAFLHDDDLLLPNYIESIGPLLESETYKCIVPQRYLLFEGKERGSLEKKRKMKRLILETIPGRYIHNKLLNPIKVEDNIYSWQNCYCAPSCGAVFRKKALLETGLFFPEGTYSWDFISFRSLNKTIPVYIYNRPLSVYRMTSGLSMRPEVQLDFFDEFEALRKEFIDHPSCGAFLRRFDKEIQYLNYKILDHDGVKMVESRGQCMVTERPSYFKYSLLMLKRMIYISTRHLDVEIPMSKKGYAVLREMGVLNEQGEAK